MVTPSAASSPAACALAGFPASAGARVEGAHVNGDFAAVYVVTEERQAWFSIVRRDGQQWMEIAGSDGGNIWVDADDDGDGDLGVVAYVTPVDVGGTYLVRCGEAEAVVSTPGPYLVALITDAPPTDQPVVRRLGD